MRSTAFLTVAWLARCRSCHAFSHWKCRSSVPGSPSDVPSITELSDHTGHYGTYRFSINLASVIFSTSTAKDHPDQELVAHDWSPHKQNEPKRARVPKFPIAAAGWYLFASKATCAATLCFRIQWAMVLPQPNSMAFWSPPVFWISCKPWPPAWRIITSPSNSQAFPCCWAQASPCREGHVR